MSKHILCAKPAFPVFLKIRYISVSVNYCEIGLDRRYSINKKFTFITSLVLFTTWVKMLRSSIELLKRWNSMKWMITRADDD
jgi:hypothetical protein